MDPELVKLMEAATAALEGGADPKEVDAIVRQSTGGRITSAVALADTVEARLDRQPSAPSQGEDKPSLGTAIGDFLRIGGQTLTFGLLDEAAGLAAGAGAALVPGGRGFSEARREETARSRQRLRESIERAGPAAILPTLLGAVAGPGVAGGRFALRGAGTASRIGRGAAAGAVEGAVAGAGVSEGGIRERLPAAGRGAAAGGITGGLLAGGAEAVRGVRALRRAQKAEPTIGPRLSRRMRDEADLAKPSETRADIRTRGRRAFKGLDEIDAIPDANLRTALQADELKGLVPKDVASGSRPPSFPEAQGALRQLRRAKDRALNRGDAANFGKMAEAEARLSESLADAVEGFGEANKAYAREAARGRALAEGQKLFSKSADEVQEAFGRLSTDAERLAFREGLAARFTSRLDDITAIPSTLKKIAEAPETRAKLRIVLGDEGFDAFEEAALAAQRTRNRAKLARRLKRDFMVGAASALGGGTVAAGIIDALN